MSGKQQTRPAASFGAAQNDGLFRLLIDTVRDYAIFALDPNGYVLTWNAGAERFKGYKAHEIIGRHFSVFYPRVDVEAGKPDFELKEATRIGRFEDEAWRVRKDGTRFWASVLITALRDDHGNLVGFAKITRDLTERRENELQAIEDTRKLAQSETESRTKSDFLAAMSHELRTPLNAIGGYTDLLCAEVAGPLTEEQRKYIGRIEKSQQHLLGIINDVLNFSKIRAGRLAYEISTVPVREVLGEVLAMMDGPIGLKKIEIDFTEPPADYFIRGDRPKVGQVILNLLSNAMKFTEPGGRIGMRASRDGHTICMSVSDSGRGIPKENFDRIFEPFVQIGRSLTSDLEGTGLGLAISREIAAGMGGSLTVESEVGRGSTFTLCLPSADK